MNSKKLWQAFVMIFLYLLLASLAATGSARLFHRFGAKWGFPFAVGCVLWTSSLAFCVLRKESFLFTPLALLFNAIGAGFFIGAYTLGKQIGLAWQTLPLTASFVAATYLLFMALLSVAKLKRKIWYVSTCFALFMAGSVALSVWLCPLLLQAAGLAIPAKMGMFLLFFLLLFGFLTLGSLAPVEDFTELLTAIVAPALAATFFILVIALLCLAGCDDCDCGDGCDSCCDCGDCSGGQYNSTTYGKRNKTTMSQMSDIPNVDV